jgi:hypothetical protein
MWANTCSNTDLGILGIFVDYSNLGAIIFILMEGALAKITTANPLSKERIRIIIKRATCLNQMTALRGHVYDIWQHAGLPCDPHDWLQCPRQHRDCFRHRQ